MGCRFGGMCVSGMETGDLRRLSGVMGYVAIDGMAAMDGYRGLHSADAAEYDTGGMEMADADEWCKW